MSGVCVEIKSDTLSSSVISSTSCGASMTSGLYSSEASLLLSRLTRSVPSIPLDPVISIFIAFKLVQNVSWLMYQTEFYIAFCTHLLFLLVHHVCRFQ